MEKGDVIAKVGYLLKYYSSRHDGIEETQKFFM